ncbi:CHAT domain-containing protein [Actinoplanes sp. NPDC051851]|uniref:CHAT domain-containing protein n=1 Tax=Actinoplanes sp. NPDC051851 TaxID=3154753 RepID=UPI003439F186
MKWIFERSQQVRDAVREGDFDSAAQMLLAWYPLVEMDGIEEELVRDRGRVFLLACIAPMKCTDFLDHPLRPEVERALWAVADELRRRRHLIDPDEDDLRRVRELVGQHHALRRTGTPAVIPCRGGLKRQRRAWQRRWRRARWVPAAMRTDIGLAWITWTLVVGAPALIAEAYHALVLHLPADAATREGDDRIRFLTAVQEHTEEAGYWLAKDRRYRDAVIALEVGRAIVTSGTTAVTYPDVTAVTGDGSLVYLASSHSGGYALIVAAWHDPQFLELPGLSRQAVAGLLDRISAGSSRALRDLAPVAPESGSLTDVLTDLWNRGLSTVVHFSGRGRVITFLPVGVIGLLPLHAAGLAVAPDLQFYMGTFSAVRYAPNARALRRSREIVRELGGEPGALLAVDVPDGAGAAGSLRHVGQETEAARHQWAGAVTVLNNCTWPRFREAAPDHGVWHLACHGAAEPRSILESRLVFADRQVTLRELREVLPCGPRRLAVLSACETNLSDPDLPNEVVGMPSALLEAGFAGVIASSWKVDDRATALLMAEFYRQWRGAGHEPAVALNRAQNWLRAATRDQLPGEPASGGDHPYADPRFWAAFAYTGA